MGWSKRWVWYGLFIDILDVLFCETVLSMTQGGLENESVVGRFRGRLTPPASTLRDMAAYHSTSVIPPFNPFFLFLVSQNSLPIRAHHTLCRNLYHLLRPHPALSGLGGLDLLRLRIGYGTP